MFKLSSLWGRRTKGRDPCEDLAILMLEEAVRISAKAVVFGVPQGVEWDVDRAKAASDEQVLSLEIPGQRKLTPDDLAFVRRSASLHYGNGYGEIPVWFEAEGKYREAIPIPAGSYGALLAAIHRMLVSLDASEESRQPMRYIELYTDAAAGRRRFAEIELIMTPDNTVRLEVLALRTEGPSIRVSSSATGHSPLPPRGPRPYQRSM